jgi:hypothetical protein
MPSTLSQASALNPGADLWVVADLNHSKWTSKLDWHLNFQIAKASRHKSPELSPFLKEALEQTGQQELRFDVDGAPLLIQSESLLPNKWILIVPYAGDMKAWLSRISKAWTDLKKPSIRIFLPTGQSASQVTQFEDITLVLDLSH